MGRRLRSTVASQRPAASSSPFSTATISGPRTSSRSRSRISISIPKPSFPSPTSPTAARVSAPSIRGSTLSTRAGRWSNSWRRTPRSPRRSWCASATSSAWEAMPRRSGRATIATSCFAWLCWGPSGSCPFPSSAAWCGQMRFRARRLSWIATSTWSWSASSVGPRERRGARRRGISSPTRSSESGPGGRSPGIGGGDSPPLAGESARIRSWPFAIHRAGGSSEECSARRSKPRGRGSPGSRASASAPPRGGVFTVCSRESALASLFGATRRRRASRSGRLPTRRRTAGPQLRPGPPAEIREGLQEA